MKLLSWLRLLIAQLRCDHPDWVQSLHGEFGKVYLEIRCPDCQKRRAIDDVFHR